MNRTPFLRHVTAELWGVWFSLVSSFSYFEVKYFKISKMETMYTLIRHERESALGLHCLPTYNCYFMLW